MKPNIIFIQSAGEFSKKEKEEIAVSVQKVFLDASKTLGINTLVNFTFYRFGKNNSGFTQAKDWITITIPKGRVDFVDLKPMLYHELHHIARGYCGFLEKGKHYLLNSLFSEGLATSFELDHSSPKRKMTHHKYTLALVKKWLPYMKKELYNTNEYDYAGWFQGKGKPSQLGYKIGKYMVDQVRNSHPEMTHGDLVRKNTKELLKLSKIKF